MLTAQGRKVKSIEEAEAYIRHFMEETLYRPTEGSYGKSYDFDLFLPYMMDWILSVPQEKEDEFTPTHDLERIYMEAGWRLCQKGFLRPGPRTTGGEGVGGDYGKGYSLTMEGRKWLTEFHEQKSAEKREAEAAG